MVYPCIFFYVDIDSPCNLRERIRSKDFQILGFLQQATFLHQTVFLFFFQHNKIT